MPSSMVLKPSADRVIIEPDAQGERKIGSIILPDNAWSEYRMGTVIAVGPGPTGEHGSCPMTSRIGDRVIYPPSLGRPVPVRQEDGTDKEYMVIRQHEVTITIYEDGGPNLPMTNIDAAGEAPKRPPAKGRGKK